MRTQSHPLLAFLLLADSVVTASQVLAEQESLEERIQACATIDSDKKRLKCFDALAVKPVSKTVEKTGEQVGRTQRAGRAKTKGATINRATAALPAMPEDQVDQESLMPSDPLTKPDLKEIASKLLSVEKTRAGLYVFRLGNGQVWQQLQSGRISEDLLVLRGREITIKKGLLGSHSLKITGRMRAIKVERVK